MFKTLPNVQFIPSMGNHEPYPVNVYSFAGVRDQYLRDGLASSWESWIGKDAADQMRTLGYYATVVDKYNLKVVALNMQVGVARDKVQAKVRDCICCDYNNHSLIVELQSCDWWNWMLIDNPTDPGSELRWLREQLQDSENKNQAVWLIGHIPSNDCL